jgi:retron-type reverse transcriptase
MLKAGSYGKGRLFPSERRPPQGSVVSPLPSNILLTPSDQEMRRKGYQLTRFTEDWVVTCKSAEEARLELQPQRTRIVHVQYGFEFLGYKIKRGKGLKAF